MRIIIHMHCIGISASDYQRPRTTDLCRHNEKNFALVLFKFKNTRNHAKILVITQKILVISKTVPNPCLVLIGQYNTGILIG